jgi:hypothetical protein
MKIYYSEKHRDHYPPFEIFDGGIRVPYFENPDRMDRILDALKQTNWADLTEPDDFGLDPILAVHDEGYINFLASCWDEWLDSDPEVAATPEAHAFLPATFALRRKTRPTPSLRGRGGYYMMDLSACIVAGTYKAALVSANCALSAQRIHPSSFIIHHLHYAAHQDTTLAKITRVDIVTSTMQPLQQIGYRKKGRPPSWILTITAATAHRIFSTNETTC